MKNYKVCRVVLSIFTNVQKYLKLGLRWILLNLDFSKNEAL